MARSGSRFSSAPAAGCRTRSAAAALLLGALLVGLPASHAHAASSSERTREKHAAEAQRAELQKKLSALKHDIDRTESARSQAADALAQAETAISKTDRALYELAAEQRRIESRIAQLGARRKQLADAIAAQKKQLAALLRGQYINGNEDRIKLLLSGDNPNRINRDLQYMGYVSKAQARLIGSLQDNLKSVEDNQAETRSAQEELAAVEQKQRSQKAQLEQEKKHRGALLAQLSHKLAAQRRQAGHIERDQQRLSGLVERLARLIEQQRKAEAAAREQRRRQQLAREQARRAAEVEKMRSRKSAPANPDSIDNDEAPPPKSLARNELTPDRRIQDGEFSHPFASLRGHLRLPVRGDLISKYGSRHGNAPSSKGVFIRTEEGAEVKAVADGQVVFADWLRGFGNLLIIDHGNQYMTIYGNNESVLKHAGDMVRAGDVIAKAGNSGGSEQSGLYFEMRHQGRAFDPLDWVTIR